LGRAWQTSSAKGTGVISSSPARSGMMLTDLSSSGLLLNIPLPGHSFMALLLCSFVTDISVVQYSNTCLALGPDMYLTGPLWVFCVLISNKLHPEKLPVWHPDVAAALLVTLLVHFFSNLGSKISGAVCLPHY